MMMGFLEEGNESIPCGQRGDMERLLELTDSLGSQSTAKDKAPSPSFNKETRYHPKLRKHTSTEHQPDLGGLHSCP